MPYKSKGKVVYVKRNGRWVKYRTAESEEKARKMAIALNLNVKHK